MPTKNPTTRQEPWYVEERLHALAVVHLTRRDDLALLKPPADSGLDYIVEIRQPGRPIGRRFGVQLVPWVGDKRLRDVPAVTDVLFPICILSFDIDSERGDYGWPLEPVVTDRGDAKLIAHTGAVGSEELDRKALDQIVAKVNQWYDALQKKVAG